MVSKGVGVRTTGATFRASPSRIKAMMRSVGKDVFRQFALDQIRDGRFDPRGKPHEEVARELLVRLVVSWKRRRPKDASLRFVIDHTDNLLALARSHTRQGQAEVACILYATWMEHWLNLQAGALLHRRGARDDQVKQLLRQTNLEGKTALVEVLSGARIRVSHAKVMLEMRERRNEFAHYKWGSIGESDRHYEAACLRFEKTVSYLKAFEVRRLLHGFRIPRDLRGRDPS